MTETEKSFIKGQRSVKIDILGLIQLSIENCKENAKRVGLEYVCNHDQEESIKRLYEIRREILTYNYLIDNIIREINIEEIEEDE